MEKLEGTKTFKNKKETFSCCNSSSSLACKPENSHVEGKILEGIKGSVLGLRLGKGSLDLSTVLGGLFRWQVCVINDSISISLCSHVTFPEEEPSWDRQLCSGSVNSTEGQSPTAQRHPWQRDSQPPGICALSPTLPSSPSRAPGRLQVGWG